MLNTPWWAWIALANAAACLWAEVSMLDELNPPQPLHYRWVSLVVRGVAVLCCLVLGGFIVAAIHISERRRRAPRVSPCPPGCASAAGEAPRAPQKVAR